MMSLARLVPPSLRLLVGDWGDGGRGAGHVSLALAIMPLIRGSLGVFLNWHWLTLIRRVSIGINDGISEKPAGLLIN